MWTRQHKKRNTGALIVPAVAAVFLSYFGFHAFQGEYGIYAKYRLEERVAMLEGNLARVSAERTHLERRVQLLHDGTLEKDMLDEHARRALNLALPDEIVIMRPVSGN
ncbi:septum formation initiator family protein [Mesorhizobium microcysteis]|uniref:Septum formation initiator family protein n=1 Tax=Neoaquamicrobium microcysteis TaxID=2682781 RepID=A0A5D4H1E5_9HYPH|nr:septum formation initiator family protein [Mesorhizobium microcysteis]TYR33849.1 septum formation initiator family protein [Mesorhizobium microcysteis]